MFFFENNNAFAPARLGAERKDGAAPTRAYKAAGWRGGGVGVGGAAAWHPDAPGIPAPPRGLPASPTKGPKDLRT